MGKIVKLDIRITRLSDGAAEIFLDDPITCQSVRFVFEATVEGAHKAMSLGQPLVDWALAVIRSNGDTNRSGEPPTVPPPAGGCYVPGCGCDGSGVPKRRGVAEGRAAESCSPSTSRSGTRKDDR